MATPNALFALINVSDPAVVDEKMKVIAPWLSFKLQAGQWLIVAPSATTTMEVCERVGINANEYTGIVLRVESYYGRNPQSTWEWITAKQAAELGAAL
jgi:hypothetical protein